MKPKGHFEINWPLDTLGWNYFIASPVLYQYQFGFGISKMVGPKKQEFWPKINILKGNQCILKIQGAPVCQKLDMILDNKVVQKLKLEKMFFT